MTITVIEKEVKDLAAPIIKSSEKYEACKQEISKSDTAKEILTYLKDSPKSVGLLLINKGFDSMYIPPFATGGDNVKGFNGGIAVVNVENPLSIKGTVLPISISLMHELGHAKQYLEEPKAFEEKYKEAMGQEKSKYPSELVSYTKKTGQKISQLVIENENVSLHEAPVCSDLGLPFRKRYD